jgi:hypothetical protein
LENNAVFLRVTARVLLVLSAVSCAAQQTGAPAQVRADFQISGMLVDANTGQPIVRARVAVASVTQRDNFTTMITREDGRFSFTGLTAGKYTLTAQARGYLLQSFNQHDAYASSIVVGPDLDSSSLLFRLAPEGAISGVVTDEAGEAVRDAQVTLYFTGLSAGTEATRPRGSLMTDDEGTYRFRHLPPGHYLVAVSARPWYAQYGLPPGAPGDTTMVDQHNGPLDVAYPITFYGGATDAASAARITLSRGDKVIADISLQPVPALRIRLNTESPDSGRGVFVSLQKRVFDGPPVQVMTQSRPVAGKGETEIVGVAPGHYTMMTQISGKSGTEWSPSREIDVDSSGEIDKNQGSVNIPVSAKLQFDTGMPAGQAFLQLINKKSREISSERIDSDGEVVFKRGIVPGSYEVSLSSNSGIYLKSISAAGAAVTGRTIEVRPGTTVKLTISAIHGQGAITGTVLRENKPFAGAMIVLVPADPAHNQVLFRRDQSDSDGTFTLPNVVPGAYTLLAIENGWDLEWMKAEVLQNYVGKGAAVQVQPNGKYDVKVIVQ